MASQPVDYVSGLGQLPDPLRDIQQQIATNIGLQRGRLVNEGQALENEAARTKVDQREAFQRDMEQALLNPTAAAFSTVIANHPEFADQIKSAWQVRDEAERQRDLTQMGSVYSAARNGRWDLAASALKRRIEADREAGQEDPQDVAILAALESGDEVQRNAALGMIGTTLAAITGPDHFGTVFGEMNKGNEGFTLGSGQTRFDADGKPIASVAPETRYIPVPQGGKLIPIGPNGPQADASGGSAAPSSGGGAVPPQAAEVSSALQSAGLPAPVIAGFMGNFHVEGGYGGAQGDGGTASGIAQWRGERATNFERVIGKPVTEATPAEQARFVAWEMQNPEAAGMTVAQRDAILAAKTPAQAAALIDRYYERSSGKHRSRRMQAADAYARGRGSAPPTQPSAAQPGDPPGTIYGTPAPNQNYRIMPPAEVAQIAGLDPNTTYQQSPTGEISAVGGPARGQLKPWPQQALAARANNEAALSNIERAVRLLDPRNNSPEAKAARYSIGPGNRFIPSMILQQTNPEGNGFRATIGQIGGVIIKDISGAAVSLAEDERLAKWVPLVTDTPQAAREKLIQLNREIRQRNQAMDDTYSEDQGYRPFKANRAPVRVRSVQEAQRLPPGTLFIAPDGKTRRRR